MILECDVPGSSLVHVAFTVSLGCVIFSCVWPNPVVFVQSHVQDQWAAPHSLGGWQAVPSSSRACLSLHEDTITDDVPLRTHARREGVPD